MVRVIAGKAKNKKLQVPEGTTRPVTDRIKTVIFDLLHDYLPEARVLDLFAGSGAYGIEALSRGAAQATFIDANGEAIGIIKINLINCQFTEQSKVIKGELPDVLKEINQTNFDIIFCDPPFDRLNGFSLYDYQKVITTQNLFCLRLPSKHKPEQVGIKQFNLEYSRELGVSTIYFLRAKLL